MTAEKLHPSPLLERSREHEVLDLTAFPTPEDGEWETDAIPTLADARRVKRLDRSCSVWYVGDPFTPRRRHDQTHGQIDFDIQDHVAEMKPSSLGQRVAIERTLQDRRDMDSL